MTSRSSKYQKYLHNYSVQRQSISFYIHTYTYSARHPLFHSRNSRDWSHTKHLADTRTDIRSPGSTIMIGLSRLQKRYKRYVEWNVGVESLLTPSSTIKSPRTMSNEQKSALNVVMVRLFFLFLRMVYAPGLVLYNVRGPWPSETPVQRVSMVEGTEASVSLKSDRTAPC